MGATVPEPHDKYKMRFGIMRRIENKTVGDTAAHNNPDKQHPQGRNLLHLSIILCASLLLLYIPFFLMWKSIIQSNDFIAGYYLLIAGMSALFASIALCVVLLISLVGIIKDIVTHQYGKGLKNGDVRHFVWAAAGILLIAVIGTWILCPKIPHERAMQAIVNRIHAGEDLSPYAYSVRYNQYSDDGDVYFNSYLQGYLYSEDDHCNISFGDGEITRYEHIYGNWYYLHVD